MLPFDKRPSVNKIRAQRRLGLGMRTGVARAYPFGWVPRASSRLGAMVEAKETGSGLEEGLLLVDSAEYRPQRLRHRQHHNHGPLVRVVPFLVIGCRWTITDRCYKY
jgi:hypothetical protein